MHTAENPGGRELYFLTKFLDKITRESTIFGFVAFLLPSFLKICLGSFVMYLVGYIYEVTPDQLNPEDYPCSVPR
jgi:hypothetical protein